MIDINGWISIRESYTEEGEDGEKLDDIIKQIESKIRHEYNFANENYDLKMINGGFVLNITISHNHRVEHPFELIRWVAEVAPGSFGVVYVIDDEDVSRDNENKFKVWLIKKGVVDELDDPFLSPINPIIEE